MEYLHQEENNTHKFIPHVVEHSIGLNRLMYALISASLEVQEDRTVLKIKPELAPYKFAVLPLTKEEFELANQVYKQLVEVGISVNMMKKGSIGKRYKKCDAIGVPYCITIDKNSLINPQNPTFTIRDRDTMKQINTDLQTLINNGYRVNF